MRSARPAVQPGTLSTDAGLVEAEIGVHAINTTSTKAGRRLPWGLSAAWGASTARGRPPRPAFLELPPSIRSRHEGNRITRERFGRGRAQSPPGK